MRSRVALANITRGLVLLFALGLPGCGQGEREKFLQSHDAIRIGMPLREVFASGLADYLRTVGVKNAPGSTRRDRQPASRDCARHVIDISYTGEFRVSVFCGINSPSAPQLVPPKVFREKSGLLQALGGEYGVWVVNLEFVVESPPREAFGVYDHYRFTTDRDGRVDSLSPIISSR